MGRLQYIHSMKIYEVSSAREKKKQSINKVSPGGLAAWWPQVNELF